MTSFAKTLIHYKEELGCTWEEMATAIKVPKVRLVMWVRAGITPPLEITREAIVERLQAIVDRQVKG